MSFLLEAANPENAGKSLKQLRPTFYQMMRWMHAAWTEDVTSTTISNCWHKADILPEGWLAAPQATAAQRRRAGADAPAAGGVAAADADAAPAAGPEDDFLQGLLDNLDHAPLQCEGRAGAQGGAADALPQASALAELDEALEALGRGMPADALDEGDELLGAAAFTDLDHGQDVNDDLSDEDILRIVLTQGTDQPDSDEDEHDDYVEPKLKVSDAMSHVRALREYALAVPDKFSPAHLMGLDDMMSKLVTMSLQSKKQATLASAWGV